MKYAFLGAGIVCLLLAWSFGKDVGKDVSRKLLDPASEIERFSALVGLIVVAASLLGLLVCAVGYSVHVRLDAIETRLR
jgi:hypothetical protein